MVSTHIVPAAFMVLPSDMRSTAARRLLLAIGWQESRFTHRVQVGGPARGYWQFEQAGGVRGVLGHQKSRDVAREALRALGYRHEPTPFGCYAAIEHNDVLACVFARLLLWTLPDRLAEDEANGWRQYIAAWRPGKPHAHTWPTAWSEADARA